jgi:hypothetical protein
MIFEVGKLYTGMKSNSGAPETSVYECIEHPAKNCFGLSGGLLLDYAKSSPDGSRHYTAHHHGYEATTWFKRVPWGATDVQVDTYGRLKIVELDTSLQTAEVIDTRTNHETEPVNQAAD